MSLCYGAAANMISRLQVEAICSADLSTIIYEFDGPHHGIDVSGWSLVILGGALMIQSMLSIWTLVHMFWVQRGTLQSWSLDPVVNSIYIILSGGNNRGPARSADFQARKSLHMQVPRARALIRVVWATFAVMVVAVVITIYFAAVASSFSKQLGETWQFWGFVYTTIGLGTKTTDWAGE